MDKIRWSTNLEWGKGCGVLKARVEKGLFSPYGVSHNKSWVRMKSRYGWIKLISRSDLNRMRVYLIRVKQGLGISFYLRYNYMHQSLMQMLLEKSKTSFRWNNLYFLFNYFFYFLRLISNLSFILIFYKIELIWFARWSWTLRSVTNLRL